MQYDALLLNDEYHTALGLHLLGNAFETRGWSLLRREAIREYCDDLVLCDRTRRGLQENSEQPLSTLYPGVLFQRMVSEAIRHSRQLLTQGQFPVLERLQNMREQFGLSTVAVSILGLFHFALASPGIHNVLEEFHWRIGLGGSIEHGVGVLSLLLGASVSSIRRELITNAPLRRLQILDPECGASTLPMEIAEYLDGDSDQPLYSLFCAPMTGDTRALDDYGALAPTLGCVANLLRAAQRDGRGAIVVFHGVAGTGKSTAVRSIAQAVGIHPWAIVANQGQAERDTESFRWRAMAAAARMLDPRRNLLVVDEADCLDGDSLRGKSVLTQLLDATPHNWVFIGNARPFGHEALRRRVSFEVEFQRPTPIFRRRLWQSIAQEEGAHLADNTLEQLSRDLPLTAGSIHTVCRDALRLCRETNSSLDTVAAEVGRLHAQGMGLDVPKAEASGLVWRQDCLNVRGGIDVPLQRLCAFAKRYYDASDAALPLRQLCVLAHGVSGTGKSEFAKHLAVMTGRPLHICTSADVLGPFVGESEQNLRRLFREARTAGAVLFLDEVDSLLWSRSQAQRSWEVSLVNQLLQEIDSYEGLLVAATNRREGLDTAVLRRFQLKLEFLPLAPEQRIALWRAQLLLVATTPDIPEAELTAMDGLTAGDYCVVWMQAVSTGRSEGERWSPAELLAGLRAELSTHALPRRMGLSLAPELGAIKQKKEACYA